MIKKNSCPKNKVICWERYIYISLFVKQRTVTVNNLTQTTINIDLFSIYLNKAYQENVSVLYSPGRWQKQKLFRKWRYFLCRKGIESCFLKTMLKWIKSKHVVNISINGGAFLDYKDPAFIYKTKSKDLLSIRTTKRFTKWFKGAVC